MINHEKNGHAKQYKETKINNPAEMQLTSGIKKIKINKHVKDN